jgi:DNA-binding NtrC family response regulator
MQQICALIVDDDPYTAAALADSVQQLRDDFQIEVAHSGTEALAKVQQKSYALIITDYKMPGLNGLDLAYAVREVSPETQTVLMTGYGSDALRRTLESIGLASYLQKPFDLAQIQKIVGHSAKGTIPTRRVLVMEDEDELRRVFRWGLHSAGYDVNEAGTIQQARDHLALRRFDVFLCDVNGGSARGTQFLREQRDRLYESDTEIIIMSDQAQYRSVSEQLGVEFFLEKPVSVNFLVTLVGRLTTI